MSMGGSEETRSIVYLDYWGSAAGQRWRSSRSAINPSLPLLISPSQKVSQRSRLFCHVIEQPEFPSKSGSKRPLGWHLTSRHLRVDCLASNSFHQDMVCVMIIQAVRESTECILGIEFISFCSMHEGLLLCFLPSVSHKITWIFVCGNFSLLPHVITEWVGYISSVTPHRKQESFPLKDDNWLYHHIICHSTDDGCLFWNCQTSLNKILRLQT